MRALSIRSFSTHAFCCRALQTIAVQRALARYFPHTAYLRAEREAAQPRKPARKQSKKKSTGDKPAAAGLTAVNLALPASTLPPG